MTTNVLFLGPDTSFSHAAAQAVFPEDADLQPAPDFSSIFHALQTPDSVAPWSPPGKTYDCAIVPVFNSTNGPVKPVVSLLKRAGPGEGGILAKLSEHGLGDLESWEGTSTTTTNDETQEGTSTTNDNTTFRRLFLQRPYTYKLPVHHHLYVHPDCPINDLKDLTCSTDASSQPTAAISSLHTHPQVWTQCKQFLEKHFSNTTQQSHTSTSEAAKYVASLENQSSLTDNSAVLCSDITGKFYGLKRIASHVEDDCEGNGTTFVIIGSDWRAMNT